MKKLLCLLFLIPVIGISQIIYPKAKEVFDIRKGEKDSAVIDLSNWVIYPVTKKSDHKDVYHGVTVADPYNWLECDTCADVMAWVKEQNEVTYDWFSKIPFRNKIRERLTKIWSFGSMSAPFTKGDKTFYYYNTGKLNHSILYYKTKKDPNGKVLLDPNSFSQDGTTSLSGASVSPDGKFVAYSVSHKGSDWNEIFVFDITKGVKLADHLKWVKFSGMSWKGKGFFYSRYDQPKGSNEYSAKNEFHKVYYHLINTAQDADQNVFTDSEHPLRNFGLGVTGDEKFAILSGSQGTSGNSLAIADISKWKPGKPLIWINVVESFDADYDYAGSVPAGLLFLTNKEASNQRLILIDPKKPTADSWKTIIAEKDAVLESVSVIYNKLIVKYLENVSSKLYVHSLDGKLEKEIALPVLGTVNGISGDGKSPDLYYSLVSYTFPTRIYKVNLKDYTTSLYFKPEIDFESDNFETKQVFYTSKDGTKIPMFITHKKGLKIDGNNPLFLFGYGGFNISLTPEFRVDRTVFLENDGIYCVANIRGGGEFGEKWHKAGTKLQKQNVFDDFIAAAEYLIKEGYTNKDKIAAHGRSNGGLLAGSVLTQRPDLFKCVIPQVGVLDMLKFHKFTIGWAWTVDYGSSENKEEFEYLRKYSPVHNVKKIKYPATLVVTGDHDDRVVPAHSFKFIAELQDKQKGEAPVLIRIDTGGGHGSGKPLSMQIAEYSDMWTFVFKNLNMQVK